MLKLCHAENVKIFSVYGFVEGKMLWTQCHEESGYHLYPDMAYIEIIDKDGKRVPDGESGEIVYTGFGSRGTALLRYKTGDIGRLQKDACPYCGAKTPRLEPAIIRSSEIIPLKLTKVKKRFVDFNAVSALLSSLPFIEEWQIILRKEKLDEIVINVAINNMKGQTFVKNEIIRLLRSTFGFTPIIEFKKREIIEGNLGLNTHFAEKRIVDERD
jgi:phenylacetate-CoA ligase